MYPVSLFASIFPYSKQKCKYTCCQCEVHSVRSCQYSTNNCFVAVRARAHVHSNHNNLVASARLAKTFKYPFWSSVSIDFVTNLVRCKQWHVDVVNKHGAGCIRRPSCGAWVLGGTRNRGGWYKVLTRDNFAVSCTGISEAVGIADEGGWNSVLLVFLCYFKLWGIQYTSYITLFLFSDQADSLPASQEIVVLMCTER